MRPTGRSRRRRAGDRSRRGAGRRCGGQALHAPAADLRGAAAPRREPGPARHQGRADAGGLARGGGDRRQPRAVHRRDPPGARRRGQGAGRDRAAPRLPAGAAARARGARRGARDGRRRGSRRPRCVLVVLGGRGAGGCSGPEDAPSRTPSIAVLPFVSMAGETSDYLGPGVADDVISMLARSPDVLVMARGSSFAYGGAPRDVREIGKALGVDYVLEGSVRREGDKLRIIGAARGRGERPARLGGPLRPRRDATPGRWSTRCRARSSTRWSASAARSSGRSSARPGARTAPGSASTTISCAGSTSTRMPRRRRRTTRAGRSGRRAWRGIPDSALLKVKLGWSHWTAAWYYWSGDLAAHFREADRLVTEALASDNLSPETQRSAHWLNAFVLMQRGEFDDAVAGGRADGRDGTLRRAGAAAT